MKIKNILFFLVFSIYFFTHPTHAIVNNNIIVKIDKKLITSYDIKNKIITNLFLTKREINQKNINQLKRKSLEELIQIKIKEIELEKFNIKKDDLKINAYLNSISNKDIMGFKNMFVQNNLDYQRFINEIDTKIRWRELIYKIFSKKIEINLDDIDLEIQNLIQTNKNLVEYNLSELEILSTNKNLDVQKITQIKNEIELNGFEDSVVKYSISSTANNKGNLGWINSNSLNNDLIFTLKNLKEGEVSDPIQKQDRIVFFKLNKTRNSSLTESDIDSLRLKLIDQKKNELFKLYSNSYLSQLRNSTYIEYLK